jgi:hypothetical protein
MEWPAQPAYLRVTDVIDYRKSLIEHIEISLLIAIHAAPTSN